MHKTIICLYGGGDIGWGHVKRMLRYADRYFSTQKSELLFLVNDDAAVLTHIRNLGYRVESFKNRGQFDQSVKRFSNPSVNWVIDTKIDMVDQLLLIRSISSHITLFDHQGPARFLADLNIYPSPLFDPDDLDWSGYQGALRGGWEETLLPASIDQYHGNSLARNGILLTFGGSDPNRLTLKVMAALADLDPDSLIRVVLGPSFVHRAEVLDLNQHCLGRFELIENCHDLAPFMAESQVVVTAMGITIFELQYLEVPCVVMSNYESDSEDEKKLRVWDRVTCLGYYQSVTPEQIRVAVLEFLG